ncbi:MAG: hypothetical protein QOH05_4024 [Acetobacteraceae bacterium]|nr:hypothetical protein [Acetobacteraceae bacterium]
MHANVGAPESGRSNDRLRQRKVNAIQTFRRLEMPGRLEQYHPDWNREANQGDEIAREPTTRAFPLSVEML